MTRENTNSLTHCNRWYLHCKHTADHLSWS